MHVDDYWSRVKILIKKNKTTQEAVALACGRAVSTFKGWIKKDYYPTVVDGYLIARFLGVSVEYLVTGKDGTAKKEIEKALTLLRRAGETLEKIPV